MYANRDDEGNEEGHRNFQRIDTDLEQIRLGAVDSDDDIIPREWRWFSKLTIFPITDYAVSLVGERDTIRLYHDACTSVLMLVDT